MNDREKQLEDRLTAVHKRLQWIADTEARAAWVKGYGTRGEFMAERERLIKQAEDCVAEMERLKPPQ